MPNTQPPLPSNRDSSAPLLPVVGRDRMTPVLGGERRYINLDNAASTPPLRYVQEKVAEFAEWYASVHRGAGFKSRLSTAAFEAARQMVLAFAGAEQGERVVIFTRNTTDAINKLSYRLEFGPDDVVVTTPMEHHANLLTWQQRPGRVVYARLLPNGLLDLDDLQRKIKANTDRLRLVAISGASNVSGYIPPVHTVAEWTHAAGAEILVDAAQLAPHRPIRMGDPTDPGHLDYLALSAHKLYAPYGGGALIGPYATFARGIPEYVGGGAVEIVTLDDVVWTTPPDRDEAGSPNVVGAVALGAALKALMATGMDRVAAHETDLTRYMLARLRRIPGIRLLGHPPGAEDQCLGVFTYLLDGIDYQKVAAALAWEHGIGVRAGCFCAHPYLLELLKLTPAEATASRERIIAGDRSRIPGATRASLGVYNTRDEVDAFLAALGEVAAGRFQAEYDLDPATGEYRPQGTPDRLSDWFSL